LAVTALAATLVLRILMTGLLGTPYNMNQASYDLARLSGNGRSPGSRAANLHVLTCDGLRFAIFYTKVHDRVLRPLMAADQPQAPAPHRRCTAASRPPDQPRSAVHAHNPA
jgi:hypothetical protein